MPEKNKGKETPDLRNFRFLEMIGSPSRKDMADIKKKLEPYFPDLKSLSLTKILKDYEQPAPLRPESLPQKPDYPLKQQLVCGDCIRSMRTLPSASIDLAIADPPYFKICGEFDYAWKTPEEYIEWCKEWITQVRRVLKPTGSFYLWGVLGHGLGWSLPRICQWIEETKLFSVSSWITLAKTRGRGNKRGYMSGREECVFMTVSDKYTWNTAYTGIPVRRTDMGQDGKPRNNRYRRVLDVWADIPEASQSSRQRIRLEDGSNFPTVKPRDACERIIRASSNVGDMLLIPFGGSGSEALVAKQLHRQFIVVEKNGMYAAVIAARVGLKLTVILEEC